MFHCLVRDGLTFLVMAEEVRLHANYSIFPLAAWGSLPQPADAGARNHTLFLAVQWLLFQVISAILSIIEYLRLSGVLVGT